MKTNINKYLFEVHEVICYVCERKLFKIFWIQKIKIEINEFEKIKWVKTLIDIPQGVWVILINLEYNN